MNDNKEKIETNEIKEKLFTQQELESIVEQRLSRERKNTESLSKIREILTDLRQNEPFKSLSNAAVAEKLSELAEKQNADMAETANFADAVPEAKENDAQSDDIKEKEPHANAEHRKSPDGKNFSEQQMPEYDAERQRRQNEIAHFIAAYDEDTLASALSDNAFRAFCIGKQGGILELYNSYRAFLSALSDSPEARKYRAARSGLASTGFSGSASSAVDYGELLTDNQKKIAKASGMSYKQYAELLSQIPSKKLNFSK